MYRASERHHLSAAQDQLTAVVTDEKRAVLQIPDGTFADQAMRLTARVQHPSNSHLGALVVVTSASIDYVRPLALRFLVRSMLQLGHVELPRSLG
jgi:hypothetical protein